MYNLKIENYVLFGVISRTNPGKMSPKNNSKDVKEEPEYIGDFAQKKKKSSQTSKDYCQSQKNQTSK